MVPNATHKRLQWSAAELQSDLMRLLYIFIFIHLSTYQKNEKLLSGAYKQWWFE